MKNFIFIAALTLLLTGCGVGTYSIQSGVEDASYISFTDSDKQTITVAVDDKTYTVETVMQKAYKSGREIKQTALNTIKVTPGQHDVAVYLDEERIYSHKVFLSTGETKVIEL